MGVPDVKIKPGLYTRSADSGKKTETASLKNTASRTLTQTQARSTAISTMRAANRGIFVSAKRTTGYQPNNQGFRMAVNSNNGWDIAAQKRAAQYQPVMPNFNNMGAMGMGGVSSGMMVAAQGLSMLNQLASNLQTKNTENTKRNEDISNLNEMERQKQAQNKGNVNGNNDTPPTLPGNMSNASFTQKLGASGSFKQIKGLESEVNNKKENLSADYKSAVDVSGAVNNIIKDADTAAGLKDAGVNLDTSKLVPSNLDSSDLAKCLETAQEDKTKIGQFKTTDITEAYTKIADKKQQVTIELGKIDSSITRLKASKLDKSGAEAAQIQAQIDELTAQKKELEAQQAKLDRAKTALGKVEAQCNDAISKIDAKITEIKDIQKFEAEVKDKKVDLAKSQDKELKQTMDKINDLTKQLEGLKDKNTGKYDKSDEKRLAKAKALINQRSALYATMNNLTSSLSEVGNEKLEDAKGKEYKIQNLDKAMSFGEEPVEEIKPDASQVSGDTGNNQVKGLDAKNMPELGGPQSAFNTASSTSIPNKLEAHDAYEGLGFNRTSNVRGHINNMSFSQSYNPETKETTRIINGKVIDTEQEFVDTIRKGQAAMKVEIAEMHSEFDEFRKGLFG